MSDTPPRRERDTPELDISTPGTAPAVGWRDSGAIWAAFLLSLVVVLILGLPVWWSAFGIMAGACIAFARWLVAVQIIRRGVFTWKRLANAPAKAMARGDAVAAEAAFAKALARARRFAPDDSRRAVMLGDLALYAKNQGRYPEALALFEENVAILARHLNDCPLDYFVALNNLAIYHTHLKDYPAAQNLLERAFEHIVGAKKKEAEGGIIIPIAYLQPVQILLHLNAAFLLIEMNALAEAREHLHEAGALLPLLGRQARQRYADHYVGTCALWEYESGRFADAENEIAKAANRDYYLCMRVRASLHRVRGEFAEAERLLRLYLAAARKHGTLHRPELLKTVLELAECLHGRGQQDAAFEQLQEARSLVADFKLPPDAFWRQTLMTWLQRARDLGRSELAASLEAEIDNMAATIDQSITVLEKLRISSKPP